MTKLIAEIGINHLGNMDLAKTMIKEAKLNGADIVKTQLWQEKRLKSGPWDTDGRREIYKKSEVTNEHLTEMYDYATSLGIRFMASVFSEEDAKRYLPFSNNLTEGKMVKIPSQECVNKDLVNYCLKRFDDIIISVGATTQDELESIRYWIRQLMPYRKINITVMHCISAYPCPPSKINFMKMVEIEDMFDSRYIHNEYHPNVHVDIGFSDHTEGIEITKFSLAYNPVYIEKHFTISNALPFRDNKFAILPQQLRELKEAIKLREEILKDEDSTHEEQQIRELYRGRWCGKES